MVGQVGLDIDDRCTIEGVQSGDSEHVTLPFQQLYCGFAYWIGPVGGTGAEKPDEWTFRVMPGVNFHWQWLCSQSVHPVEDNNVGEFVQIVKRLRQGRLDFNAGHDVVPVVRRAGRFPDGISHDADRFYAERGLLPFYFQPPLFVSK